MVCKELGADGPRLAQQFLAVMPEFSRSERWYLGYVQTPSSDPDETAELRLKLGRNGISKLNQFDEAVHYRRSLRF